MELENPLITIIIPIYNREQTLERCLCSVLRQTYSHLEIIAVDDGSTDHSRVILDKYQKKDSRLRVVRKENSGVSESRNLGLQLARGEYIQFVDADDWITLDQGPYPRVQPVEQGGVCQIYDEIPRQFLLRCHLE